MAGSGDGRVVIVIVSYGRPQDVARCLAAVAVSTKADYEIVVVENAGAEAFDRLCAHLSSTIATAIRSTADIPGPVADPSRAGGTARRSATLALAPRGQPLTLVEASGNLGYGGGINVALAALTGAEGWRGVLILNPDTEPAPDALAHVVAHAERGGHGLTGCRVAFRDARVVQLRGGTWRRWIGRGLGLGIGEPVDAPVDVAAIERRLDWVSGAAMYATRAFIEQVGPMDHSYFLYCEDVDWSLRRGGFRLGYAHEAVIWHEHGTTIGSSVRHAARSPLSIYLMERNKLLLTRRHFPVIYPLVAALCLAGLAQSYLLRGNLAGFRVGFRGWAAGILGETGAPPAGAIPAARAPAPDRTAHAGAAPRRART